MKTVLFADDNKHIREFCRRDLEEEGYRVVVARNGCEAVRLVRAEDPDLAVLDIFMPAAGGLDVIEHIKRIDPALPVVLFTSYDEECLRDRRSRLAEACVEKCEDLAELKRVIVRLLAADETTQAVRSGLPPTRAAEHV